MLAHEGTFVGCDLGGEIVAGPDEILVPGTLAAAFAA